MPFLQGRETAAPQKAAQRKYNLQWTGDVNERDRNLTEELLSDPASRGNMLKFLAALGGPKIPEMGPQGWIGPQVPEPPSPDRGIGARVSDVGHDVLGALTPRRDYTDYGLVPTLLRHFGVGNKKHEDQFPAQAALRAMGPTEGGSLPELGMGGPGAISGGMPGALNPIQQAALRAANGGGFRMGEMGPGMNPMGAIGPGARPMGPGGGMPMGPPPTPIPMGQGGGGGLAEILAGGAQTAEPELAPLLRLFLGLKNLSGVRG